MSIEKWQTVTQPYFAPFKKIYLTRLCTENFLIFLLQYTGLMLNTLTPTQSPIWFASGTACAFIFLKGYSVLPGIALGSFVAYFFAHAGFEIAVGCAITLTLQAFFMLWIGYRLAIPTLVFYQARTFLKFICYTSLITLFSTLILVKLCSVNTETVWSWWLANFNGVIILGCGIVSWDAFFPEINHIKPFHIALLVMLCLAWLLNQIWITLPIMLWLSYKYRWRGAIAALFVSGLLLGLASYLQLSIHATSSITVILTIQIILGGIVASWNPKSSS